MAEATAIRQKAAAGFAKETSEQAADIAAMGKAIVSIEKGASGFLQTSAATVLKRLVLNADLSLDSRDQLTSFLSDGEDEDSQGSGEIVGILKQMKETMEKDVKSAGEEEASSIKDYDALTAAKTKEATALTSEIESKMSRLGEVGTQLVDQAQDLTDTEKALVVDTKFLGSLDTDCKTKAAEWQVREKTRSEELVALSDTIKLLNDDDALELFKKPLPSASFLQLQVSNKDIRMRARKALRGQVRDYRLDLISMSLKAKKVNFQKVLGMIDDMVGLLKKEQVTDDKKKVYCAKEFDSADDEQTKLKRSENDLKKAMADEKESVATLVEDIAALDDGIKALDGAVAKATSNRKEENAAYTEELAANNAAVEIIGIAKNRMNKFYNPKMYKAPPAREMSESERISVNMGGEADPTAAPGGIAGTGVTAFAEEAPTLVQISAHMHVAEKRASGSKANGVIAMMDILIKEVKKDITESKFGEKDAQGEYETFMSDSAQKRAVDAKSIAEKESARAETSAKLQKHKEELKGTVGELYANAEFVHSLHGECDWLLQNFNVRKSARAGEVDALTKAKAVLSGADA